MAKKQTLWAVLALILFTFGGLISAYQLLFALWMTAYPKADTAEWRTRFYIRLAITIGIAICWVISFIWFVREESKSKLSITRHSINRTPDSTGKKDTQG
jgi:hypothetical protein